MPQNPDARTERLYDVLEQSVKDFTTQADILEALRLQGMISSTGTFMATDREMMVLLHQQRNEQKMDKVFKDHAPLVVAIFTALTK